MPSVSFEGNTQNRYFTFTIANFASVEFAKSVGPGARSEVSNFIFINSFSRKSPLIAVIAFTSDVCAVFKFYRSMARFKLACYQRKFPHLEVIYNNFVKCCAKL